MSHEVQWTAQCYDILIHLNTYKYISYSMQYIFTSSRFTNLTVRIYTFLHTFLLWWCRLIHYSNDPLAYWPQKTLILLNTWSADPLIYLMTPWADERLIYWPLIYWPLSHCPLDLLTPDIMTLDPLTLDLLIPWSTDLLYKRHFII